MPVDSSPPPEKPQPKKPNRPTGVRSIPGPIKLLLAVLIVVLVFQQFFGTLFPFARREGHQWIGQPAPELVATTIDGQTIQLSQLRGRRVVLNFWATWCGPCRRELPHFQRLATESANEDLLILGVSTEDRETVRQFATAHGLTYQVGTIMTADGLFARLPGIPTTFIIDRDGTIRDVHVGYLSFERLEAMAAGIVR